MVKSVRGHAQAVHRPRAGLASLRARLAHLPRDTRDTLFHLLVIAWIILPSNDVTHSRRLLGWEHRGLGAAAARPRLVA